MVTMSFLTLSIHMRALINSSATLYITSAIVSRELAIAALLSIVQDFPCVKFSSPKFRFSDCLLQIYSFLGRIQHFFKMFVHM